MRPRACCDFHDDPAEIEAHIDRQQAEYEALSKAHPAPEGWETIAFGDDIPSPYRPLDRMAHGEPRWLRERRHNTMTPMWARPAGWMGVFARRKSN